MINPTKQRILGESLQLFNNFGFVNVRLQHIADASTISVGHLAYHFRNKDCIVETLYDQSKNEQEILLYEFRTAHLFEDVNLHLKRIFQLQKQYLFIYLDVLELFRTYPAIKEKHPLQIAWQLQQIEWMFEFNVFRGSFQEPSRDGQYKKLVWLFWITMNNWMYYRQVTSLDHLSEEDFVQDLWSLLMPYFSAEGLNEFQTLAQNSSVGFVPANP